MSEIAAKLRKHRRAGRNKVDSGKEPVGLCGEHYSDKGTTGLSASRLDSLLRVSPAGTALVSAEGRFLGMNPSFCRFLGYSEGELLKLKMEKVIHPDDFIRREKRGEDGDYPFERRFLHKDGPVKWGLVSVSRVGREKTDSICELYIIQDISEKKGRESALLESLAGMEAQLYELQTANRELESFNYTVSHDLRSPLTTIRGFCELLLGLGKKHLDDQCKSIIRHICGTVKHMDQLIEALLHFSLISKQELKRESVDLAQLATTVAVQLRMRDPNRNVEFSIIRNAEVEGDAKLLREVLENLMENAWKYTGKQADTRIEFGMCVIEDQPTYYVSDNGPGFDMAHAESLFVPFHRLHSREEFAGYGIGLSIAQRIILRHGGRIWAEGEPGGGAKFLFTLPG